MSPIASSTCEVCGENLPNAKCCDESQICPACQEERPSYQKAVAYGTYDGELRELIHLLKYEHVRSAASVLGGMLAQAIAKLELTSPVVIVPVPLHASKRRQRGFNQAELISKAAMKRICLSNIGLANDLLQRTRPTVSQTGLTRSQRRENIRGAFRVVHLNRIKGRRILLVDDVMTTGTTASECARVLLRAGAEAIWVATVARTLKNSGARSAMGTEILVAVNQ